MTLKTPTTKLLVLEKNALVEEKSKLNILKIKVEDISPFPSVKPES
jgi:hypothetical protein